MSTADETTPRSGLGVIEGADAESSGGLPSWSELPLGTRVVVGASASFDLGLRTAAASLVAASMAPALFDPRFVHRERERLAFYAELGRSGDAARSFPSPGPLPPVRRSPAGSLAFRFSDGKVHMLRFDSPFEALNPAVRRSYGRFRHNRVACAQYWHHDDGPRPTLCLIHGFMGSAYLLNGRFFSLPWFFRAGYDVLLFTLPFHGARREPFSPYSGHGFFAHGLSIMSEAMAHAVHDFRLFVDYLQLQGAEQVAVTGMSLGAYTAALLAAVEPRLKLAIPNVAVSDMAVLFRQWVPAGTLLLAADRLHVLPAREVSAAMAFHSPLTYPPVVPKRRRLIIVGLGDRLAPPEQSRLLWEHWDRCQLFWFPGNHVGHVNQSSYLRRMTRFMRSNGFAPPAWLTGPSQG